MLLRIGYARSHDPPTLGLTSRQSRATNHASDWLLTDSLCFGHMAGSSARMRSVAPHTAHVLTNPHPLLGQTHIPVYRGMYVYVRCVCVRCVHVCTRVHVLVDATRACKLCARGCAWVLMYIYVG